MKNLSTKLLLISILLLIVLFLLSKLEYQNFTYQILYYYKKTDKIDFFRQNLLTETRFLILKLSCLLVCVLFSILFLWKGKVIQQNYFLYTTIIFNELKYNFNVVFNKIKSTWKKISFLEKIALFVPLIIYVVFWWIYGWQNDEVFSYTFFVDRGILVCATYYPGPNNHVAFLIFSAILNKIIPSFFSDFICLKLPATLAAIFSLWSVWLFFYQKNQKLLAWLCFVLIAFHWSFFFYATHGRGYSWIILFFLASCFAVFKIISFQNIISYNYKKYWFLWSLCMILGCYTIPIFIYVWFGSLCGLWVIGTNKTRKESIFVSFISGTVILILYSPILLFNGFSAIISNSWVAPLSFENWLEEFVPYLWNVNGNIGLMTFLFSTLLFFSKKEFRKVIIYFWCIAYSPYLIAFIQRVLPFERVFLYRQIAEILMLCFCIGTLVPKKFVSVFNKKIVQIVFIFLTIFYINFRMYKEYYQWNINTNVYQFAEPLAKKLYKQKPVSILVLEDTYAVFLRYYFRNSDTKVEVLSDILNTEKTNYQIIILPKNNPFSSLKTDSLAYSVFYEDDFVKGFERK